MVWANQQGDPVTLGHIRGHGVTRLLVYCVSGWCHHSADLEADWLSDDTTLLAQASRMVCTTRAIEAPAGRTAHCDRENALALAQHRA